LEKKSKMRHGAAVIYGIIFVAILSKNLGKLSLRNHNQIIKTAKKIERNIGLLKNVQKDMEIKKALKSFFLIKLVKTIH